MLDDRLVRDFEAATVDPSKFHHREHLHVAWCYLRALPLEAALARFVHHLRALTCKRGAPEKFHATIAWTYFLLLDDAMHATPDASFEELLARHPRLSDRGAALAYYDAAELTSAPARQRFVLPRRA